MYSRIVFSSNPTVLAGNTVVLEIAPETFVVYARLVPGSIRVAVGDDIGNPLGRPRAESPSTPTGETAATPANRQDTLS